MSSTSGHCELVSLRNFFVVVGALALLVHAGTSAGAGDALAPCPAALPAQGAALRGAAPLFPPAHWWNQDIRAAPVDRASDSYLAFIDNGGTRRLHPDFGGEVAPGSTATYGIPYAVVDGTQARLPVTFDYSDESDGTDASGAGVPFYPIPAQAIAAPHWIEGGAPGNVDQRTASDRHLIVVDCANARLYELYNVWHDAAAGRWYAGSGAFFDLTRTDRRPEGWTSADAAGLAILPGLVRYDEAWNPAVAEIGHAFRVTVRATNGYVYPASHRAGSTPGALPMGARLRLRESVAGEDPALRTSDPNVRKIFRAMQTHGLIVADNGSDLYVTGTFDVRWNNDLLNPAFALLRARDFEVIELGWRPAVVPVALAGLAVAPTTVAGGADATGTVTLAGPAPVSGVSVALASDSAAVIVPASLAIAAGQSAAGFTVATTPVAVPTATTIAATVAGTTRTATLLVMPAAALATLAFAPASVRGRATLVGSVQLAGPAPAGGATVALVSSRPDALTVPPAVVVPAGARRAVFRAQALPRRRDTPVTVSATLAGVVRTAEVVVTAR